MSDSARNTLFQVEMTSTHTEDKTVTNEQFFFHIPEPWKKSPNCFCGSFLFPKENFKLIHMLLTLPFLSTKEKLGC